MHRKAQYARRDLLEAEPKRISIVGQLQRGKVMLHRSNFGGTLAFYSPRNRAVVEPTWRLTRYGRTEAER